MKNKKFVEEKDVDEMLKSLFIEENSVSPDENAARFVFDQEYDVKVNSKKEKELLRRLNGKPNGSGGFWTYLIITIALITAGIGIVFYNKHLTSINKKSQEHFNKIYKNENTNLSENASTVTSQPSLHFQKIKDSASIQLQTPFAISRTNVKPLNNFSADNFSVYSSQPDADERLFALNLFAPSEQDFIFYSMVKSKMLEKLLNIDKALYTAVEEGEIQYRGNPLAVDPFVMRNQAITNLEYKVFLSDLIKNIKNEDFKKASVRSVLWKNYDDNTLADSYFLDEKYNDFPVVNIGREGALLFCSWLEGETNQLLQRIHPKAQPLKIRLPYDSEWIFATRRGYSQLPDCGGYKTIYDIREGIVDINFIKRIELIKRRGNSKVTELDQLFASNRYGMEEEKILKLFEQGFAYKGKPITDSLYPNRMDVFSKAAHVSEINQEQGTGKTVIIGSCWNSKEEYLKMVSEFNKETASPFVGFRVVIINDNKASYKNPFW